CAGGGVEATAVLDLLTQLVDKSLVVVEERRGRTRYRFLETVREYAGEQLRRAGEAHPLNERHLAYYLGLAETAEPAVRGADQVVWLDRLEEEHANLRAALAWSLDGAADDQAAMRLAGALWWFRFVHGHWDEDDRW